MAADQSAEPLHARPSSVGAGMSRVPSQVSTKSTSLRSPLASYQMLRVRLSDRLAGPLYTLHSRPPHSAKLPSPGGVGVLANWNRHVGGSVCPGPR
ncbi:hypothetical protein D9M70_649420 [compost metagenome]